MAEAGVKAANTRADRTSWEEWERRRAAIERKYRPKVFRALQDVVKDFNDELLSNGFIAARNRMDFYFKYNGLYMVLLELYITAGVREARITRRELNRVKRLGTGGDEFIDAIKRYFERHLLSKSVIPILDTTKDKVKDILSKAQDEGWGVEKTARYIYDYTTQWNRNRTRTIVRTETVRSANFTKLEAAKKNKFETVKVWITAKDERVRGNPGGRYPANKPGKPNHWKLHGKELPLEGNYENGCEFPGDPNGAAKEVINCRCTLVFRTKRDRNGNPIPKRTYTPTILTDLAQAILQGITIGQLIREIANE